MVFVPGISQRKRNLERRKGGGGGGRGGGGGSSGGRGGSSGSGGSSGGSLGAGRTSPISSGGTSRTSSSTSAGGGPRTTIPQGQLFAGRSQGGGTRDQVYGNRAYGSGYPGSSAVGVGGLGFPFFYWPVIFGSTAIIGTGSYLHTHGEYGDVNNSSRPGGALMTATFPSNANGNTTFRIMADNSTVTSLTADILSSCGSSISNSTSHASTPYNETGPPIPAQAIQYYRASSIVLSLDSYNNTAVYSNDTNAPPSPLPNNIDTTLLRCLNSTIGISAPLVDGALDLRWSSPSGIGLFAIVWVVSRLMFQV
ncbi:hypothetical protein NP233_g7608 [Leucocoprinus birnbaumii]|uniref:Uncharacterized protein n=1 Tax=Leucocoprinus birnbaumii TaxID=56174 RepID=A0AAD5VP41_9AGAR|nr:hypothetical protein NP233_g7608 [Leucocoprinus birnbaumii]